MNPQRVYEYLVRSRECLLDAVASLSDEEYVRAHPIGPGSVAVALTHILLSEWYYIERMHERDVPPYEEWDLQDERPLAFGPLRTRWEEQARATRLAIESEGDWERAVVYELTDDDGRRVRASCSAGDLMTQLALHETHHRAQVLSMLRRMGVTLEDIDFNAMMFDRAFIDEDA